jgi:hypothetical protein
MDLRIDTVDVSLQDIDCQIFVLLEDACVSDDSIESTLVPVDDVGRPLSIHVSYAFYPESVFRIYHDDCWVDRFVKDVC